jgi:hypothetical protein
MGAKSRLLAVAARLLMLAPNPKRWPSSKRLRCRQGVTGGLGQPSRGRSKALRDGPAPSNLGVGAEATELHTRRGTTRAPDAVAAPRTSELAKSKPKSTKTTERNVKESDRHSCCVVFVNPVIPSDWPDFLVRIEIPSWDLYQYGGCWCVAAWRTNLDGMPRHDPPHSANFINDINGIFRSMAVLTHTAAHLLAPNRRAPMSSLPSGILIPLIYQ